MEKLFDSFSGGQPKGIKAEMCEIAVVTFYKAPFHSSMTVINSVMSPEKLNVSLVSVICSALQK